MGTCRAHKFWEKIYIFREIFVYYVGTTILMEQIQIPNIIRFTEITKYKYRIIFGIEIIQIQNTEYYSVSRKIRIPNTNSTIRSSYMNTE